MKNQALYKLTHIFADNCDYKAINQLSNVKMRNKKDGILLKDAINYRFQYAAIHKTKQQIVSNINNINDTSYSRQAYEYKERNISIDFYELLFIQIATYYNNYISRPNDTTLLAIDGVYNRCCVVLCGVPQPQPQP